MSDVSALSIAAICTFAFLVSACSGPFSASGRVVDQYGNPLTDVRLHTTAAVKTEFEADAYGGEKSSTLPDGKFKVRCGNCAAVHLFFSKEGYHPQSVDLAFFEWSSNMTIVLQEKGPPVDLDEYQAKISAGPDFDDTVMVFAEKEARVYTEAGLATASVESDLPFIALRPATNEDGDLIVETREYMQTIKFAELDFSGANGAAQLYEPRERSITYAYAEMGAAPVDGYTPTIRLENKMPGELFFFYCIIDGYYCKGMATAPSLMSASDEPYVQITIEAFVNQVPSHRGLDDPRGYLR